jgi:hypothetical protein
MAATARRLPASLATAILLGFFTLKAFAPLVFFSHAYLSTICFTCQIGQGHLLFNCEGRKAYSTWTRVGYGPVIRYVWNCKSVFLYFCIFAYASSRTFIHFYLYIILCYSICPCYIYSHASDLSLPLMSSLMSHYSRTIWTTPSFTTTRHPHLYSVFSLQPGLCINDLCSFLVSF